MKQLKQSKMTPTKKQIAEVTSVANQMNVPVEAALSSLSSCSASIYKGIGAKGVVETAKEVQVKVTASQKGGFLFSASDVLSASEKALLISINTGVKVIEKWIAKSIIINDNIVPFWAVK